MAIIQNLEAFVQSYPAGLDSVTDLQLSQNENGRQIRFTIGGVTIPAGSVATISGTKPDGVVYSNTGTIEGADTVIFDEDVQMTAVFGTWYAKIRITNAGNTIASARVRFIIDKDPVDAGAIPSESQLDGLVAEAQEYAEAAEDAAERAATTYGSPLTASTASAMTDINRVYVYTGSESGYTYGNWYYYTGSAWVSGGVYNSAAVETDTTLTESGVPADAKATGDKIDELRDDLSDTQLFDSVSFTATAGTFIRPDGTKESNSSFSISEPIDLKAKQTIRFVAHGYTTSVSMISKYLGVDAYSPLVISVSSAEETYEYTALEDCQIVLCYDNNINYKHDCYIYLKVYDAVTAELPDASIDVYMLNSEFSNLYYDTENKMNLSTLKNGYINVNTGVFTSNDSYRCSDYIECGNNDTVYIWSAQSTGLQAMSFVFYDEDYIVKGHSDYWVKYSSIPSGAKYVIVSMAADALPYSPMVTFKNERPYAYIPYGRYIKKVKGDYANYMHLFTNIGIIGDSLSSGTIYDENGNHEDLYKYSWLANICRDIEATPTYFSAGGMTSKAWLTSVYKTTLENSTTDFECYYIALGTNDQNQQDYSLGDITDTAGTNSFVGYYKQIIDIVHTKSPNSVIFLVSMYDNNAATWSDMIRSLAGLYEYCYYVDFIGKCDPKLYIPQSRIYTPFVENWHYTGLGYIEVGHTIENVTNDVIDENLSAFKFFTAGFFET